MKMDDATRKMLLQAVQNGLPLASRPFREVAGKLGWSEGEVVEGLRYLVEEGVIKRVAGVVNHRKLRYCANALVCWRLPEESVEEIAHRICQFRQVSHCYQRAGTPEVPYNLYAMVHAGDKAGCEKILTQIHSKVGPFPSLVLWSTKEFKKSGLPLLSGREFEESFPPRGLGEV